ncbi:hypothetical protein BG842_15575 [Haladaptatus sp. W1]|uniref:hypothetical protein n=1 Tax=Haladaptatus sp. W1 TaxID=1897478 RepID=UPI000849AFFA|nr:hypothetical protein [Haladaptatus sp. W1]ODR82666.1 hypothetical protein BG842_15575 [Haladaptatus sp. W1]
MEDTKRTSMKLLAALGVGSLLSGPATAQSSPGEGDELRASRTNESNYRPGEIRLQSRDVGRPVNYLIRVSDSIYSTRRHSPNSQYHQVEWQLGGSEPTWDQYRFSGRIERFWTSSGNVDIVIRQRI